MSNSDPRIDAYIAKSADFAEPILTHLRKLVHHSCPEVQETMKWSVPHFEHKGILCSMAAFKQHCTFGFWKSALIFERGEAPANHLDEAHGQFGRITSLSDLPPDEAIASYVKKAVELNDAGVRLPARSKPKKHEKLGSSLL